MCLAWVQPDRSWIVKCLRHEGQGIEDFGFPCIEVRWQHPVVSGPLDVEPGAASRTPARAPSGA